MVNYYLEVLELPPGAEEKDVQKAFKRLSKKFHPDYGYKKLIEIYTAYYVLDQIGPKPNNETVNYQYNPDDPAFEEIRESAYNKAVRKLDSTAFLYQGYLNNFYNALKIIGLIAISFNLVLVADMFLQPDLIKDEIVSIKEKRHDQFAWDVDSSYFQYNFKNYSSVIVKNPILIKPDNWEATLTISPIMNKLWNFTLTYDNVDKVFIPFESVYRMWLFKSLLISVFILYILAWLVKDFVLNKLTLNLAFLMAFLLEIGVFVAN